MPLYYFHCRDAQDHASATYGIECPHLVAAHIAALDGALSMIADAQDEFEFPVMVEIDDEDGRPLLQAPLSRSSLH